MADILVVAVILFMALWGMRSGFIKAVFHFGYYIISVIAAMILYPALSKILLNSRLSAFIHDEIIMPRIAIGTGEINMPSFLQQALTEGINNTTQTLAASLTEMIINIICFMIVFVLVRFGLKFVVSILDSIAKLPLLNIVNKLGGIGVGVLNGFILVYILLAIATIFMNDNLFDFISNSNYTFKMYNDNILLKLLFG